FNFRQLSGKTLFITGASRGIGKAIALKAAQDGANIIIAAKTAEPHPKLPGTIFTAAKEDKITGITHIHCQEQSSLLHVPVVNTQNDYMIEAIDQILYLLHGIITPLGTLHTSTNQQKVWPVEEAGGKCLPCAVDIRDDGAISKAVQDAVKKFGGIDILVNNASAISLTGTSDTTTKKYDLMNSVNARGTFLCSKACLPFLKKAQNPHILNITPPLNMKHEWFKDNVAYSISKFGMTLCVLGMSQEFKNDGIAVNGLWPKKPIATVAVEVMYSKEALAFCRTDQIMADAAYALLTRTVKQGLESFFMMRMFLNKKELQTTINIWFRQVILPN
ncbi:unnamed protein product, partial [Porites evermanni]